MSLFRQRRWTLSTRGAALFLLALPLILLSVSPIPSSDLISLLRKIPLLSPIFLSLGVDIEPKTLLLSYTISIIGYWWITRKGGTAIAAKLVWIPLTGLAGYICLDFFYNFMGYQTDHSSGMGFLLLRVERYFFYSSIWTAIVRFILRLWKKV